MELKMVRSMLIVILFCVEGVHTIAADTQTDYDKDKTIGDCDNTFRRLFVQNASLGCSLFKSYMKCAVRVSGLHNYTVADSRDTDMNNKNTKLGGPIGCNVEMQAISVEVANDQNAGNSDKDKTIGDCLNTFTRLFVQNASLGCSLFRSYMKCAVRVSGLHNYTFGDSGDTDMNNKNAKLGGPIGCNVEMQAISAEVARDQNAGNSDPGFITSFPRMLVLLLPWICSYFFQF